MKEKEILDQKAKHLVFLGASIGSGCRPCTKYHVTKSLESGFTGEEIDKIISLAISVRDMATRNLESFVKDKFHEAEPVTGINENTDRSNILVGIATSYAVNFHPGFLKYKILAQKAGISDEVLTEILRLCAAVSEKARSILME